MEQASAAIMSSLGNRRNTAHNRAGLAFGQMVVRGDGPTNKAGYGILCTNRLDEFRHLNHVRIENEEPA